MFYVKVSGKACRMRAFLSRDWKEEGVNMPERVIQAQGLEVHSP